MHDPHDNPNAGRHIPFKQEGWGVAMFVVALALLSAGTAAYIHNRTYKHPTDVRFQAAGSATTTAHE